MTTTPPDAAIAMAWCGPDEHGIPRLGRQIAGAAIDVGFAGAIAHVLDPAAVGNLVDELPAAVRVLHLQVNDWLFAAAGVRAEDAVAALGGRLTGRDIRLTLTLHDLPQFSDGAELYRRRCSTYRTLVRCAAGVVVSSDHERILLQKVMAEDPALVEQAEVGRIPVEVIPLPIDPVPVPDRRDGAQPEVAGPPTVGIFGYLYPGKGHREVLDDLAGMAPAPTVLAIGRASDRHAALLDELSEVATGNGIRFRCTGYVADAELAAQLRAITVPVAPHTHISASGSINSWLAAGRRPLVPAGRYVTELDARLPGSVWIYPPGELRRTIGWALVHPELTWLSPDIVLGPTTPQVAAHYLDWLRQQAR